MPCAKPLAAYNTLCLPANSSAIQKAARFLRQGEVVAMPTETVYGLAASAFLPAAVQRIFAAKGRPQDNPLIVHISCLQMLQQVATHVTGQAQALVKVFWPGPLTLVLPAAQGLAPQVCAQLSTVGVRMPAHPVAMQLIQAAGVPLAAPSANISGGPSPTTAAHVMADMKGRIPMVLDGGTCKLGLESTVLSLVGAPRLLRPGCVTVQSIEAVLGQQVLVNANSPYTETDKPPASPGVKYRHYAPKADVTLVQGQLCAFTEYARAQSQGQIGVFALCFFGEEAAIGLPAVAYGQIDDASTQAAGLFAALRQLDEMGAKQVYARMPSNLGVGMAVENRLLRAAQFKVVQV